MRKENRLVRFTSYGATFEAKFNNGCSIEGYSDTLPHSLSNLKYWNLNSGVAELYSIELENGEILYDIDADVFGDFFDAEGNVISVSHEDKEKFDYLIDGLENCTLSDFAHDIEGE